MCSMRLWKRDSAPSEVSRVFARSIEAQSISTPRCGFSFRRGARYMLVVVVVVVVIASLQNQIPADEMITPFPPGNVHRDEIG